VNINRWKGERDRNNLILILTSSKRVFYLYLLLSGFRRNPLKLKNLR